MKSNLTKILFFLLACAMVSACGPARLRVMVDEFNKQCPVSLGVSGTMDSAAYNAATVSIYYTFADGIMNLDMVRENEQLFHDNMLETYANDQNEGFKKLINAIIDAGASLDVIINTDDGDSHTIHFTADEIKNNRPTDNGDPVVFLQKTADNTRLQLPMDIGSGITFVDVTLDDKYFSYIYVCDEDYIDMDALQEEFTNNRKETIANIDVNDPMMAKLFLLMKAANRGFSMKYTGKTSGKTATIKIEPEEL